MLPILQGVGFIAQAIADVFAKNPPDINGGYTDLMKGLGLLGVHQKIIKVMADEEKKNNPNPVVPDKK
jgi:hypothetical protein